MGQQFENDEDLNSIKAGVSTESDDEDDEEYIESKTDMQHDGSSKREVRYLQLGGDINVPSEFPSISGIYIRKCYQKFIGMTMYSFKKQRKVLLNGTPGLGNFNV